MLMRTLTDAELRRVLDVRFKLSVLSSFCHDLDALHEAAQRFLQSEEALAKLEDRIEELEQEVDNLESEIYDLNKEKDDA